MACFITGTAAGDDALYDKEELDAAKARELELTRMLCAACRELESLDRIVPDIAAWWKKHKAQDEDSTE